MSPILMPRTLTRTRSSNTKHIEWRTGMSEVNVMCSTFLTYSYTRQPKRPTSATLLNKYSLCLDLFHLCCYVRRSICLFNVLHQRRGANSCGSLESNSDSFLYSVSVEQLQRVSLVDTSPFGVGFSQAALSETPSRLQRNLGCLCRCAVTNSWTSVLCCQEKDWVNVGRNVAGYKATPNTNPSPNANGTSSYQTFTVFSGNTQLSSSHCFLMMSSPSRKVGFSNTAPVRS